MLRGTDLRFESGLRIVSFSKPGLGKNLYRIYTPSSQPRFWTRNKKAVWRRAHRDVKFSNRIRTNTCTSTCPNTELRSAWWKNGVPIVIEVPRGVLYGSLHLNSGIWAPAPSYYRLCYLKDINIFGNNLQLFITLSKKLALHSLLSSFWKVLSDNCRLIPLAGNSDK